MNWVLLYTSNDPSEALVMESVLESEGIEYKVAKESIGDIYKISMDGLGEVKIYVPEEKLEAAKELIASKSEN
ncbi:MAG: hypothetical protein COV46_03300 [Deltaproteobacteria bacterium CG11_big_fil_rev_8_21_14_0_20_49_13]|nr:MAG: hypothetical protein COV46_03300 [Deltaproteobacteria bacterium CG11_big_fil_rev_8_21_14_0_20_49_13]